MSNLLITEILKTLMFKKNLNTTSLAKKTGVPQQTLQRIVAGKSKNPHEKTLKPLADFFDISLEQLKEGTGLNKTFNKENSFANPHNFKKIPVIPESKIEEYLTSPSLAEINEFAIGDKFFSDSAFAFLLNNKSMEPYFPKGSLVIFDSNKAANDRNYVLVKIKESNTLLFRQLILDGEIKYLKALNPDLNSFPMRVLKTNDSILGVMTEFRHRYEDE